MAKRYPVEQRERATRMALDRFDEYGSAWAVAQALGSKRLYATKRGARPLIGVAMGVCQSMPQWRSSRSR